MDQATNAADASVDDVRDLTERQTLLQTEYIKNENRVNAAEGMRTIANIQSISMMFIQQIRNNVLSYFISMLILQKRQKMQKQKQIKPTTISIFLTLGSRT